METKKIPISIYAEATPNPSVMKFVANRMLVDDGAYEFKNIEEARISPLATKLFHFPFVKEIFISANFIAIAKYNITEWNDVALEVREFISSYLQEGNPIVTVPSSIASAADETCDTQSETTVDFKLPNPEELGEVERRIVEILDEYVKPAVEQDGGNIVFVGYDEGVVKVLLRGACSGCPSSTLTLKNGILTLLQRMLPTLVKDVEAING
ncbi:MAG: NifU family protein [Thermaurantimonas sp.]|uniref:NifU family protein n=1 Tax=Thermaurantimonas sp. TaxID=2681568 RepID=UPI00391AF6F9